MRRRATHADSWYTGDSKSHSQLRAEYALSNALRVRHIAQELNTELEKYLQAVQASEEFTPPVKGCKAIIAPYVLSYRFNASQLMSKLLLLHRHAGYSYSGPAAAWAYKSIDTTGMYAAPRPRS